MLLLYVALCAALFAGLSSLSSSFLPDEDQGYFMSSLQLPSDATMQRTLKVVEKFEEEIASRPAIESNIMIRALAFQVLAPTRPWPLPRLRTGKTDKGSPPG